MFKSSFKKRKKAVTRLRSDSTSEEDVPKSKHDEETKPSGPSKSKNSKSKKKNKKKGIMIRSFDVEEGGEDIGMGDSGGKKKKSGKRKRGGLGFGGTAMMKMEEDDENGKAPENEDEMSSLYDKHALEKLKQEQKYKAPVAEKETSLQLADAKSNEKPGPSKSGLPEDEYIPLEDEPTVILTGDEALQFDNRNNDEQKQEKEEAFDTVMEDANFLYDEQEQQQAEEATAWEAEITRRAGLAGSSMKSARENGASSRRTLAPGTRVTNAVALTNLRSQVQSTILQLKTQQNDADRSCERRRVEQTQAKSEFDRQQKELTQSGQALEEYQKLREQLTFWTGALRDLKSKVQPIQEALIQLDSDIAALSQWKDLEDDMCSTLHDAGLLDQVLGRQPDSSVFESSITVVDEFGRDVKSQYAMNREKRAKSRLEKVQRRNVESFSIDTYFFDENDLEKFRQRRAALGEAMKVALNELEAEFTEISELANVFRKWQSSYPEDYKQCYADLSLGDLASVLAQADICKVQQSAQGSYGWLDGMSLDKSASFDWEKQLVSVFQESTVTLSDDVTSRIVQKCFIPLMAEVLDNSALNLASTRQNEAFSTIFGQLVSFHTKHSIPVFPAFANQLFDSVRSNIDGIAIVILNNAEVKHEQNEDGTTKLKRAQLEDATCWAMNWQVKRLSKILLNVFTCWAPHFYLQTEGKDMVDFLLDFLSSKYLFLMSSLRGRGVDVSEQFSQVWRLLKETAWLDQPGRMLQAAPLRAAAIAFDVNP